jgi:tetratricopeptide (TPR) repeat protein
MFRSALLFSFFAVFAAAQTNSDAPSDPLEPANSALHAGDIDLAVTLLQALVAKDPPVAAARPLLVDILLDQDKVDAAEDIVQKGLASNPESGDLHRLKGDVDYRKGDLKSASSEYAKAAKMNSKDARALYGTARVASALSLNQTAFLLYRLASRLAPHDEAIVGAFTRNAATDQEQADALERYLASLDRDGRRRYQWLVARMELRKFLAGRRTWQLASPYQPSKVRLKSLMDSPRSPIRFGVDVRVNGAKSVPLLLDTGASGVVINRVLAEQAGVKRIADLNLSGIGDKADPTGYLGFAESVRVGDVEFRNCIVHVSDKKSVGEAAGLIGPAIFERFLVTLDFFRRELSLGLLPDGAVKFEYTAR